MIEKNEKKMQAMLSKWLCSSKSIQAPPYPQIPNKGKKNMWYNSQNSFPNAKKPPPLPPFTLSPKFLTFYIQTTNPSSQFISSWKTHTIRYTNPQSYALPPTIVPFPRLTVNLAKSTLMASVANTVLKFQVFGSSSATRKR